MHATYSKLTARERDLAPRYYYKRTKTYTLWQRLANAFRYLLAFLFTQVGICALVAGYMVVGAGMFSAIEAESQVR